MKNAGEGKRMRFVSGLFGLLLLSSDCHADTKLLKLGILPYVSPATLARLHQPLKQQLDAAVPAEVLMRSAPDYPTFRKRTAEGRYDILITAPHLGRLAQRQGYELLAFTSDISHAIIVTRRDSPIKDIADIAGRSLIVPPASTLAFHMSKDLLQQHGLDQDDYQSVISRSHDDTLIEVQRNRQGAAVVARPAWNTYLAGGGRSLRALAKVEAMPGFAIMMHSRLSASTREALRNALFGFPTTEPGAHYFEATALKGIRVPTESDFEVLDRYLGAATAAKKP